MADVLSQSQIDALLKSMQGGTAQPEVKENVGKPEPIEKKIQKIRFLQSEKIHKREDEDIKQCLRKLRPHPDFSG